MAGSGVGGGWVMSGYLDSGSVSSGLVNKPPIDAQQMFLYELLLRPEEVAMISALHEDVNDQLARREYVDYLLDHNRTIAAERVRKGFTPGTYATGRPLAS